DELREAVASYAARAAEKLRRQGSEAQVLTVFIETNRFADEPQYAASTMQTLSAPTAATPVLIRHAVKGMERLFRQGFRYKKAGVMLANLAPARTRQRVLFENEAE